MHEFEQKAFGEDAYEPKIAEKCQDCPRLGALSTELRSLHTLRVALGYLGTDIDELREICYQNALEAGSLDAIEFYATNEFNQEISQSISTEIEKIDRQRAIMFQSAKNLQEGCHGAKQLTGVSRLVGQTVMDCRSPADPLRVGRQVS